MDEYLPLVSVMAAMTMLKRNKNANRSPEELERIKQREEDLEAKRLALQVERDRLQADEMARAPRAFRRRQAKAQRTRDSGNKDG